MMLNPTDLCVAYTVRCAELGDLPPGLTLIESPPPEEPEPDEPDRWPVEE